MALTMTSAPLVEPVTASELKSHMRIDGSAEDVLLASLILTARLQIETALKVALMTQSWRMILDSWPKRAAVELPLSPVQSVDAVRVKTSATESVTVPPTSYLVDLVSRPARLVWNSDVRVEPGIRANGIEIDITAGFGATAASVPAPLKHATLMLAAHWYEHRDPIEIGSTAARIPEAISDMIQPFRTMRL